MQNLCEMSRVVSPAPLSRRGQGEEWGGEEGVSKSLAAVTCMNTKGTRETPSTTSCSLAGWAAQRPVAFLRQDSRIAGWSVMGRRRPLPLV